LLSWKAQTNQINKAYVIVGFNMGLQQLLDSKAAQEERALFGLSRGEQLSSFQELAVPKMDFVPLARKGSEYDMIEQVADEYKLTGEKRKLLHAIRGAEQGRQGREFGVLKSEAMRFEKDPDPVKSFVTQARWAAGTIKKRFDGDLEKFAKRWAPIGVKNDPTNLNKNWLKNVRSFLKQ